jgi:hypothetical protein
MKLLTPANICLVTGKNGLTPMLNVDIAQQYLCVCYSLCQVIRNINASLQTIRCTGNSKVHPVTGHESPERL